MKCRPVRRKMKRRQISSAASADWVGPARPMLPRPPYSHPQSICSFGQFGFDHEAMTGTSEYFGELVGTILARYFRQNDRAVPPSDEVGRVATRLWALVKERGLPRPLTASERGTPGEMSDEEVSPLLDRVLGETAPSWRAELETPVRQLVKACFYPEFKTCRDSFRALAPDGTCRRQEITRTRGRVSGVHCVDCPHWVALTPAQHAKFLVKQWVPTRVADFTAYQEVFLPEDFRALRVFLYRQARIGI